MEDRKIIDFYYIGDSQESINKIKEFLDQFSLRDYNNKYQIGNFNTSENYSDAIDFDENSKIIFVEDHSNNYSTSEILSQIKNQNKINWTPNVLFTDKNNTKATMEASFSRISHMILADNNTQWGYKNIGKCIKDIIEVDFPNLEKMDFDSLTGCYLPGRFKYFLSKELEKTSINSEYTFGLCLFDIIGLKNINDTYGHISGDKLIKKFVKNFKNATRDDDEIIRRGGDEFLGLFRNFKSTEGLENALSRIMAECIENPLICENELVIPVRYKFGFGIYRNGQDVIKFEEGIDPKGKEDLWETLENGFVRYQFNS